MPTAEVLYEENCSLKSENEQLRLQIAYLKKQLFGRGKNEKLSASQLELMLGQLEALEAKASDTETEVKEPKRRRGEKKIATRGERYEHLPVEETVEKIPEEVEQNPEAYERLNSAEETFEIDYRAPHFFRRKIVRPKFRLKANTHQTPVIAAATFRVVEGLASAGLLAQIMVAKYQDHLPLYRQAKIYKRQGCELSKESMVRWVEKVADWLKPIYNHMGQVLLDGDYIQADETPVTFCDPDMALKKSKTGYFCGYSKPEGDVIFVWKTSRSAEAVTEFIKDYTGLLQSDAYAPYVSLAKDNDNIVSLGCMAHARRYFVEASTTSPREAALVIKLMAKLYAIEKQIREAPQPLSKEAVEQLRQSHATNTLARLKRLMLIIQDRTLPTQPIRKAVNYSLSNWQSLKQYIYHGQTQIDNNLMENAIRPTALGKKNWMFIGHPRAGQRSAIIYSILACCQRQQVNPTDYLKHAFAIDTINASEQQLQKATPSAFAQTMSRG